VLSGSEGREYSFEEGDVKVVITIPYSWYEFKVEKAPIVIRILYAGREIIRYFEEYYAGKWLVGEDLVISHTITRDASSDCPKYEKETYLYKPGLKKCEYKCLGSGYFRFTFSIEFIVPPPDVRVEAISGPSSVTVSRKGKEWSGAITFDVTVKNYGYAGMAEIPLLFDGSALATVYDIGAGKSVARYTEAIKLWMRDGEERKIKVIIPSYILVAIFECLGEVWGAHTISVGGYDFGFTLGVELGEADVYLDDKLIGTTSGKKITISDLRYGVYTVKAENWYYYDREDVVDTEVRRTVWLKMAKKRYPYVENGLSPC